MGETTALIRIEGARRALAEAKTLDEVREIRDQAEAVRLYAKKAGYGREMVNDAAEIKLDAERKAGAIIATMAKQDGGDAMRARLHRATEGPASYADLQIEKTEAHRWQRIASVPEEQYRAHVDETRAGGREITTAGVLVLADLIAKAKRAAARTLNEQRRASEPVPLVSARIEVADATELPLDSNTVDLIVTSPPYGLDKPYLGSTDPALGWREFMVDWLAEAYRVATDTGRLALNVPLDTTEPEQRATYAEAIMAALEAGWRYRWSIVWNEGNVTRTVARGSVDSPSAPHVIARVEMIAVFYKGEWARGGSAEPDLTHAEWLSWTDGLWDGIPGAKGWEGHPAPFPEELPRRLIKLLSWPGDTVLDPFLGSGTTALVAWDLGRAAIGFDIAPQYVASARRRLTALVAKHERDGHAD